MEAEQTSLDSSQSASSTTTPCVVCGASAAGLHFGGWTCLSCKVFFRRNAYNDQMLRRCSHEGICEINENTRRSCPSCRLKKCFEEGMVKEQLRPSRQTIIATVASRAILLQSHQERILNMADDFYSHLSQYDRAILANIVNAYEEHCIQPFSASHATIPVVLPPQPYRARLKCSRFVDIKNKYSQALVSFIKHIHQYEMMSENDQRQVMKQSVQYLYFPHSAEMMNVTKLRDTPWHHDQLVFDYIFGETIVQDMTSNFAAFRSIFTDNNEILPKLFLVVLAFSSRLLLFNSTNDFGYDMHSLSRTIINIQNTYVSLLWNYMCYRMGQQNAVRVFILLIARTFRTQLIESSMHDVLHERDDLTGLAELTDVSLHL